MYKNITNCVDGEYLKNSLSKETLNMIEDILEAYNQERIDFIEPRDENDESNFDGEFQFVIKDPTYVENGNELLVLKWYENYEDTRYLVECLS